MSASSDDFYKNGHSCLVPLLLIVIVVSVGGYFLLKHIGFDFSKLLPNRRSHEVAIIDPSLAEERPKPVEKPAPVEEEEEVEEEEPPPKSMAELKAEADEAQKKLDAEIAAARTASKGRELKGFAGVRFGTPMDGSPIKSEQFAFPSEGAESRSPATVLLMFGPVLEKPFMKFDNPPHVRVTPKTHRIFQIEFSQSIVRQPGWAISDATTNLVAALARKLKCEPLALDYEKFPLGDHTFVFPLGATTVTVGEYGGERLKMTVETSALLDAIASESKEVQAENLNDVAVAKPLASGKYPNSGMVKFGRLRVRTGTPKAFCGIVFGSLPPYSASVSAPMSRNPSRWFYIDYRKTRQAPFMTFDHGQAELSAINNAVVAVNLYSDGSDSGLGDEDFFRQARSAIEHKFKVSPKSAEGDGAIQKLTYEIADLSVSLGPDPRGGFYLKAVNTAMKAAW